MRKKKDFLAGLLLCLVTTVAITGCIEKNQQDGYDDVTVMTFGQYLVDYDRYVDNETKQVTEWFRSLDEGDTLIIRDTINDIMYLEPSNVTLIDFASTSSNDGVIIEGDITQDYAPGDNIILQVTIIRDTFTWENTQTGELWTYNLEIIQEMWDTEQKTYVPIPSYCLRHGEK